MHSNPMPMHRTMEIHHTKHYAGYTNKLNDAVAGNGTGKDEDRSYPGSCIEHSTAVVRNNGGGYWNHKLFWEVMSPNGGTASERMNIHKATIARDFGSFDKFKEDFFPTLAISPASVPGWAWFCVDKKDKALLPPPPTRTIRWMDVAEKKGTLSSYFDVWEHAYYLNYQRTAAPIIFPPS